MTVYSTTPAYPEIKPPVTSIGLIGWIRANLFNSWFNSILTLLVLAGLCKIVPPFVKWAFIDSLWTSSSAECHASGGACWSIITANIRFILFGFYPPSEQWRPLAAIILLVVMLLVTRNRAWWHRSLLWAWAAALLVMWVLMRGGFPGLPTVESTQWGGLPLTLVLAIFGLTAAYPLGVILALGRQSRMPAIKALCIIYIELIRGVPLISLLFMSSIIFPLFLPEGVTVNKIIRAQAAIILFTAAYIAEVVRGGLQAVPKGQFEAADSLGLNYFQTMRLVVLPQALKIVIPPTVSILISAFKDTSLVVIIALYDILKTTQATLSNPKWMGFSTEAYIFLAVIYFVSCFFMSNWSRRLEKDLSI
ncbi:amino acid ABC transporter permease [Desulfococcus multivorans]|jgi:general L-amino acid transport system permease protein|uniref:Polar amino acid ABC transporter, inner membrane subunit n=1 Tax=Desulfococcus multivorans DSM 2059 TaxID=1121405 RepID=S7T9I5_DESML|nr:amino acid ABC transporter permease [Desulfococcus multivorans]AOY57318.1 AapM1: general L-amino-acid transport system, permease protein [Desulfococcus multivorans]AQU99770.1 amino acid ABC transporter permease [Desulfococcus multivorans]EPR33271.1 polar amino acid ABC transporter, inner membrane subunit [Desulfococcus multivorans DSM 2059]MDX9818223.1 amino acid ABC transporter permease [Desulfococcus multivorans]SKA21990.1 general L-amino acid transport system permease protein [Desulfococ